MLHNASPRRLITSAVPVPRPVPLDILRWHLWNRCWLDFSISLSGNTGTLQLREEIERAVVQQCGAGCLHFQTSDESAIVPPRSSRRHSSPEVERSTMVACAKQRATKQGLRALDRTPKPPTSKPGEPYQARVPPWSPRADHCSSTHSDASFCFLVPLSHSRQGHVSAGPSTLDAALNHKHQPAAHVVGRTSSRTCQNLPNMVGILSV